MSGRKIFECLSGSKIFYQKVFLSKQVSPFFLTNSLFRNGDRTRFGERKKKVEN